MSDTAAVAAAPESDVAARATRSGPLTERQLRIRRFVRRLQTLADPERADRATLAALREGLRRRPGDVYPLAAAKMAPEVVPFVVEDEEKRGDDRWFYTVAALFALHPKHADDARSLGSSFHALADEAGSDSVSARFTGLIAARPEYLPDHLRHAVSLLKAHDVPINYVRLLEDLLAWEDAERTVPLRWARDFYRKAPIAADAAAE
jgi:CRISPR system Cascade subunit CasB